MDFFTLCRKRQRRTSFNTSTEMRFFLDNNIILRTNPLFARYASGGQPFDIVRANIILRGLINKRIIEETYRKYNSDNIVESLSKEDREKMTKEMQEAISDLPYFEEDDAKIYIPFFSRSINRIYEKDFYKLVENPYKSLLNEFEAISSDPFDFYKDDLYNSLFTKLIRLKKTKEGSAYYDYDARCIYFVNKGGRLEESLPLFDRDLKHPAPNHMIEKLIPVVNAYYANKKDEFFLSLVDNRLISSRLLGDYQNSKDKD